MEGTSLVECFKKILNRIGLVHLSTRLAHAILIRVGYRFSQNEKLGFRRLNLLNGMTDPTRQHDFLRQRQRMNAKNYVDSSALLFQGICYIEPLYDKTKYLCALTQPLGTSITEALAYHMNGSLEAVPKNIT